MKTAKQLASERVAHFRAQANYLGLIDSGSGFVPFTTLYVEALQDTDRMKLADLLEELEGWNQ